METLPEIDRISMGNDLLRVIPELPLKNNGFNQHIQDLLAETGQFEKNLKTFCRDYLVRNAREVRILDEMQEVIDLLNYFLPYMVICKCIDGRVHGTRSKGLPRRSSKVTLLRTEGSNIDISDSNFDFWDTVTLAVIQAKANTPGEPALFIPLAHTSLLDHGCAAHSGNDQEALKAVQIQSEAVRKRFGEQMYAVHGMTNSDDLSHTYFFPDEQIVDISELIERLEMKEPQDIFHPNFLNNPLQSNELRQYTGEMPIKELLKGPRPKFYDDSRTSIPLEAYIIRQIREAMSTGHNETIQPDAFEMIRERLKNIGNLPTSLHPFFLYMIAWNMGYTLYKRQRLSTMNEEERKAYLGHSEKLMAYGEGFQTVTRNEVILVKPGRGSDAKALETGKKVYDGVRQKYPQPFSSVVHINHEVEDEDDEGISIGQLASAKAKLAARAELVKSVYGDDRVRILTTYSKRGDKLFYPVEIPINGLAIPLGCEIDSDAQRYPIEIKMDILEQEKKYLDTLVCF